MIKIEITWIPGSAFLVQVGVQFFWSGKHAVGRRRNIYFLMRESIRREKEIVPGTGGDVSSQYLWLCRDFQNRMQRI